MQIELKSGAPEITPRKRKAAASSALDGHLCADGGLTVSACTQSTLTLVNPRIRALDLVDCPALAEVDLRCSQQSEVHLCVRGCPDLRIIRLPVGARAFLHIDSGAQPPQLEVEGRVSLVDACWQGGRFAKQAQGEHSWSQAWVGPLNARALPRQGSGSILRVMTGSSGGAARLELKAPDDGTSDLLLVGLRGVAQLCFHGSALNSLEVLDAPNLADVELRAPVVHLALKNCPSLARLHGSSAGEQLDLHERSGAPSGLVLELPYPLTTIADSRIRSLSFKHITSLRLLRCDAVRHVDLVKGSPAYCEGYLPRDLAEFAEFGVDESSLRHFLERMAQGDLDAWQGFRGVMQFASGKNMVAKALRGLSQAMHVGVDPAEVWQVRLELYARHRDRSFNAIQPVPTAAMGLGNRSWAWKMEPDLAADGWRADWMIWHHCAAAGIEQSNEALPAMIADLTNRTEVIPHLMPWLIRAPQIESPQTIEFLIRLLTLAAKHERSGFASGDIGKELRQLMLVPAHTLQASPRRHELAQKVRGYLMAVLPAFELLVLLAEWLAVEPVAARTRILQLAAKPPDYQRLGQMTTADFGRAARTLILTGRLPALPAQR